MPIKIPPKLQPDEAEESRHPAFARIGKFENRQRVIIDASTRLFNRHGFHATSIKQIADDLGLSSAAVYYYFKDKFDLLYHCNLVTAQYGLDVARQVEKIDGTGLEKFEKYIRIQFKALIGSEGTAWILSDLRALKPEHYKEVISLSREVDRLVMNFIEQGAEDGSISVSNARITEFFVLGALNWVPRWYRPNMELDADELAEIFLSLIFNGLRPR